MSALSIVGCQPSWTAHADTNVNNGQQNNASTLPDCQEACINNPQCTGVDYVPSHPAGQKCWLSGPWSGSRNNGTRPGITHYDISRNLSCTTSGRILNICTNLHCVSKKVPTFKLSLTLSNLNRFSKFLHCWKTLKFATKLPHIRHVATLPWDIKNQIFC